MRGFLGTKLGMTRLVDEETGKIIPVTLVEVGEQVVTQVKTCEKDGYSAIQVGTVPLKKASKTRKFTFVKEFRLLEECDLKDGDTYSLEAAEEATKARVSSVSKGKGFAGRIKRHNQARGPVSHGSHNVRTMGSTGTMKPNRTIKGWKMPGRMGTDRVTDSRVDIVKVDTQEGIIALKGSVAGANGTLVEVQI